MVKIRVIYDDDRELSEVIKLLSSRLNYVKRIPDIDQNKCFLGLETEDLLVYDEPAENLDDTEEGVDYGGI